MHLGFQTSPDLGVMQDQNVTSIWRASNSAFTFILQGWYVVVGLMLVSRYPRRQAPYTNGRNPTALAESIKRHLFKWSRGGVWFLLKGNCFCQHSYMAIEIQGFIGLGWGLQPGDGAIKTVPCAAVLRALARLSRSQRFVNTRQGNFTITHRVAGVKMHGIFHLRFESIMMASGITCFTYKSAKEVVKLVLKCVKNEVDTKVFCLTKFNCSSFTCSSGKRHEPRRLSPWSHKLLIQM
jgi:hypothetical protein